MGFNFRMEVSGSNYADANLGSFRGVKHVLKGNVANFCIQVSTFRCVREHLKTAHSLGDDTHVVARPMRAVLEKKDAGKSECKSPTLCTNMT